MVYKMAVASLSCVVLFSLVHTASANSIDFVTTVPETGSMVWMLGAATAGLATLRFYLSKKR